MNYSAQAAKSHFFKNGAIKEESICSQEVILMYFCRKVRKALKVTESAVGEDSFPPPSLKHNRKSQLPWVLYPETELNITV